MSKEYIIDSDENSDYMYNTIKNIIDTCGPRAPGSEAERKAAELVKKELEPFCDSVELEEFATYPRAFLGWIRLALGFWVISYLVFLLSELVPIIMNILSLGIALFILLIIFQQFLNYKEWTPKIFPYKEATSQNVVGVIKPSGDVKKRVVVSGHIDSAFRFNLIHYFRQGYAYFLLSGIVALLAFLILYVFGLIYAIVQIDLTLITYILLFLVMALPIVFAVLILVAGNNEKVFFGAFANVIPIAKAIIIGITAYAVTLYILLFEYLFVQPTLLKVSYILVLTSIPSFVFLFFFVSRKATPGAIDNLTAVAPAMCVAKILNDWKKNNPALVPKNTEVVVAIVGCEEIGLRGSEAFAKKHSPEYNRIDTTCVNFESLTITDYVRIYTRENTTRTDLTPAVYNLLKEAAEELGYEAHLSEMPGIAGGTDAAGLVRGGLKATSIEGINYKDYLSYYHTDRDNLSIVNKERRPITDKGTNWSNRNIRCAMEMALKCFFKYLEKKDAQ